MSRQRSGGREGAGVTRDEEAGREKERQEMRRQGGRRRDKRSGGREGAGVTRDEEAGREKERQEIRRQRGRRRYKRRQRGSRRCKRYGGREGEGKTRDHEAESEQEIKWQGDSYRSRRSTGIDGCRLFQGVIHEIQEIL
jgi:hypothetical protein